MNDLTAQATPSIVLQIWAKPLHNGDVAAVVFNRGVRALPVELQWEMLGLPRTSAAAVRDLCLHVCVYVYLCVCMYMCVHMYVRIDACTNVRLCVCMYVCVNTYRMYNCTNV